MTYDEIETLLYRVMSTALAAGYRIRSCWGVRWNGTKWSCSCDCLCPLGALLLVLQPTPQDPNGLLQPIAAELLGISAREAAEIIAGFDNGSWSNRPDFRAFGGRLRDWADIHDPQLTPTSN